MTRLWCVVHRSAKAKPQCQHMLRAILLLIAGMAHIHRSTAERSAPSKAVTSVAPAQHSQSTPRIYAFQPRKGRLNTRSIAQVDIQHIIASSDHAMLQQCLREVVFGKVRASFRYGCDMSSTARIPTGFTRRRTRFTRRTPIETISLQPALCRIHDACTSDASAASAGFGQALGSNQVCSCNGQSLH